MSQDRKGDRSINQLSVDNGPVPWYVGFVNKNLFLTPAPDYLAGNGNGFPIPLFQEGSHGSVWFDATAVS